MDLAFSPEDLAFREEVRAFIAEAFDDEMRAKLAQSKNHHLDKSSQVRWLKRLGEKGWIAPDWPVEYGGTGWSLGKKYVFDMEMALAGAPSTSNMGLRMCAPVVMAFGTDEQKKQHLPKILTTDVWWCQGYSEPGSGSDLASLALKAERDGDHYVLNGSKTWTTLAQWADWMFCLVRTSNEEIKQKGISFLLIDMKSPGVTVRPIITMDGAHEVNEVFLDNVRVPVDQRIFDENKGWTAAKFLLAHERSGIAGVARSKRGIERIRVMAKSEMGDDGAALIQDSSFKRKIAELEIDLTALEFTELRTLAAESAGKGPGPESSILKFKGTEIQQRVTELALEAAGHYGAPFFRGFPKDGDNAHPIGPDYSHRTAPTYFNVRKTSIYGGSNEIQRNIIAKMVLGL
jgi:alkylation response protein AidB-like acyl-CoA dehydrogenase